MALVDRLVITRFTRRGDCILDAGAHTGATVQLFLAGGAGHVIAVEPVHAHCEALQRRFNGDITLVEAALTERRGVGWLYLSEAHDYGNTLDHDVLAMFPSVFGAHPRSVAVRTTTIDALPHHLDAWKLDIEGSELLALRGARRTLLEHPPRFVYLESYQHRRDAVARLLLDRLPFGRRVYADAAGSLCLIGLEEIPPSDAQPSAPMYLYTLEDPACYPS